jgi:hypothetical protein
MTKLEGSTTISTSSFRDENGLTEVFGKAVAPVSTNTGYVCDWCREKRQQQKHAEEKRRKRQLAEGTADGASCAVQKDTAVVSKLFQLPMDVLFIIMGFHTITGLSRLRLVSKTWRTDLDNREDAWKLMVSRFYSSFRSFYSSHVGIGFDVSISGVVGISGDGGGGDPQRGGGRGGANGRTGQLELRKETLKHTILFFDTACCHRSNGGRWRFPSRPRQSWANLYFHLAHKFQIEAHQAMDTLLYQFHKVVRAADSVQKIRKMLLPVQQKGYLRTNYTTGMFEGHTLLNFAARYGQSKCVAALVADFHADVNIADDGGFTPLANAAYIGDMKSVAILLNAGADPSIKGRAHWTGPLSSSKLMAAETMAAQNDFQTEKNKNSLKDEMLLEQPEDGFLPIAWARIKGHSRIASVLATNMKKNGLDGWRAPGSKSPPPSPPAKTATKTSKPSKKRGRAELEKSSAAVKAKAKEKAKPDAHPPPSRPQPSPSAKNQEPPTPECTSKGTSKIDTAVGTVVVRPTLPPPSVTRDPNCLFVLTEEQQQKHWQWSLPLILRHNRSRRLHRHFVVVIIILRTCACVSMYVCMFVCMYVCAHVFYVCVHMYIYICIYICIYMYIYIHIIYICIHVCIYIYICVCVCVVDLCVCLHACVCGRRAKYEFLLYCTLLPTAQAHEESGFQSRASSPTEA